jgi:hypothetical protein
VHRVQAERERGDDTEVPAAAAQCPKQVGMLRRGRRYQSAVGQYDLGLEQIVDG